MKTCVPFWQEERASRVGWVPDSRENGWEDRDDRLLIFISDREKIHEAVCLPSARRARKDLGKNSVQDRGREGGRVDQERGKKFRPRNDDSFPIP